MCLSVSVVHKAQTSGPDYFRVPAILGNYQMSLHTRKAERLAKLPFTSTSDEKHLEQLKQEGFREPKLGCC